ncbi:HAD hydrolase-like protein, partial [Escherichia coli]|nr:HAD hydrolase-like protein [Escherichia coli]
REQGIGLKTGFDGLFSAINLRGLTTALVTSSHQPDVLYNFAPFNYLDQFDLIITAEDVQHGKPPSRMLPNGVSKTRAKITAM